MRSLSGDYFAVAERLLQWGWQVGALYSTGEPPFPNETSGLITYAFLLNQTGRMGAGRETLRGVHDAVIKHIDRAKNTPIYDTLARNYTWWDAAMSLRGKSGTTPDGRDRGVTGPLAMLDRSSLNEGERVSLDAWLVAAQRWRGNAKFAIDAANRSLVGTRFHDWAGAPPRMAKLSILTDKAELELLVGRHEDAAESLSIAARWAEAQSQLFENWLIPFRLEVALLKGIGCNSAAAQALDLVEAAGPFEIVAAGTGVNITDLSRRYPTLVRAALTAVRLRDDRANNLMERCGIMLSQSSVMLDNAWGDESRYLFERARDGGCGHREPQAALDVACRRVAGDDRDVAQAAAVAFRRLGDLWLSS